MKEILASLRIPLLAAAIISTAVNALMMVSPIYMMQVYDRVITSGHVETLYALTVIAVVALILLGAFDTLRQQLLGRAGEWFERTAGEHLIDASLNRKIPTEHAFQHIGAVKRFYCAQGVFTLLDAPWLFIFAAILWWMHPWLGMVALAGAAILGLIALLTEFVSRRPLTATQQHQRETQSILSAALKNADAVAAMGMAESLKERWREASHAAQDSQANATERSAVMSGSAKAVRMIVQTAVLGVGALLVLRQELSPGGMIAASILLGRCLAPVEQGISAWKGFVMARHGWAELLKLELLEATEDAIELPEPTGTIEVDTISYQVEDGQAPILSELSLNLMPGEVTCLIGPSGSGKTTLTRLLVGAIRPTAGEIRLDGRSITGWNRTQLGKYIGYLPQGIDLLPGTLADNIRRFGEGDDASVVEAAKAANVDELIRALPDGYETKIVAGIPPKLSAGQLQRVGLARALYGAPKVVVLDEPNANLDIEGERALFASIRQAADKGATVVVVSHRPALLKMVDKVAVLQFGKLTAFGTAEEVLRPAMIASQNMKQQQKPTRPASEQS